MISVKISVWYYWTGQTSC